MRLIDIPDAATAAQPVEAARRGIHSSHARRAASPGNGTLEGAE